MSKPKPYCARTLRATARRLRQEEEAFLKLILTTKGAKFHRACGWRGCASYFADALQKEARRIERKAKP